MPEGQDDRRGTPGETAGDGGGTGTNTDTSDVHTATTTTETRWELGFFARRVQTTSVTPPDYPDKPDM